MDFLNIPVDNPYGSCTFRKNQQWMFVFIRYVKKLQKSDRSLGGKEA